MDTSRITWQPSRSLVAAIIAVVLAGLAAPVQGRTFLFTALLFGDPDLFGDPLNRPVKLTLQLTEAVGDPEQFEAIGIAHLTRTLAESYTMVQITDATGAVVIGMGDPEELPGGLTLFSVQTTIPAEIVALMVSDPNEFPVTVFTPLGPGMATGQLRFMGRTQRSGR
jgi:hypothetical protein